MDMERLAQECCPSPVSTFSAHANTHQQNQYQPRDTACFTAAFC